MFLNPYLTEDEDIAFYESTRKFANDKIFSTVEERDRRKEWHPDIWQQMCELGLIGLHIPAEYGGSSASCFHCCLGQEAVGAGAADGGIGTAWGGHFIGTLGLAFAGNDEQKQKYLPALADGRMIAGLGLTEPGSGSDAAGLTTYAEKKGDNYVLNGSKMFITNGPIGHLFTIMARTQKKGGPMGISAFLVEKDRPGFTASNDLMKLGHHTSQTSLLTMEDVEVPETQLLGPLHSGFMRIGKVTLEWERTVLMAAGPGNAELVLGLTYRYANQRTQFGKPIINYYAIREMVAKLWLCMQAYRRIVYYVAHRKDEGAALPIESSVIKLFAGESAHENGPDAVQVHGGYGYMREYHVERFFRDGKLSSIAGGSSEVQRSIISSSFRPGEKWHALLNALADDDTRSRAENQYGKSILGGELEALQALRAYVDGAGAEVKKQKLQSVQFAFADLVMVSVLLHQAYWDTAVEHKDYSFENKQRDFALLTAFLVGKYMKSFQHLAYLDEKGFAAIQKAFAGFSNPEDKVGELMDYLSTGIPL